METDWDQLFDNYGVKTVSKTDKNKQAYLPNKAQRVAMAAAGIVPSSTDPHPVQSVRVLFDPTRTTAEASYYLSARSPKANRDPEPRMGRALISKWLQIGDRVIIGNVGPDVRVANLAHAGQPDAQVAAEIASSLNEAEVLARALKAKGPPLRKRRVRDDFVRNPYVVAAALNRAKGACETPACKTALFETDKGKAYLEVHHVIPLGEGGDDALTNVAALCPRCHRELHYGKDRAAIRASLEAHLAIIHPG